MVLRKALADAERLELLDRNPAARAKAPTGARRETTTWTSTELAAFLAGVVDDPHYALWVLLATTGSRRSEALGLRWSDLDRRTLSVTQTITSIRHRIVVASPKTDRSRRQMALDADTVRILDAHRTAQQAEADLMGWTVRSSGLVFTQGPGEPLHPDAVTRRFKALMRASGLLSCRVRTTSATPGPRWPSPPGSIRRSCPIASAIRPIAITIDTYSHAIPSLDVDAAATVASQLFDRDADRADECPA